MATAVAYRPLNMLTAGIWYGSVTTANSTYIRLDSYPYRQDFYGTFTYTATTASGTISQSVGYEYGLQKWAVSGLSLDLATYDAYISANNIQGLYSYILAYADTFTGSSGNDVLETFAGNDTLTGGVGNDILLGGSGTDTAVFSGTRSQYLVLPQASGWLTVSGPDGLDAVKDVESLRFSDQTIASSSVSMPLVSGGVFVVGATTLDMSSPAAWLGTYTYADTTAIFLENATHNQASFGTFSYNSSGALTGGTIRSIASAEAGVAKFWVTGLNLDVATYDFYVSANNIPGLYAYVLTGNDQMYGSSGADVLFGYGGNDTITGGGGNDTIDGGAGADTVILSGNRASYTVSGTAANLIVIDQRVSSPDGTDTLLNIEALQFSDGTYTAVSLVAPTYGITASATSVNEGGAVTFSVATTNVAANTVLSYTLSGAGITVADISGALLSGTTTVGANGAASFTVNLTADQLTEGVETLTATVQGQTASVTVNDTSTTPVPAYGMGSPTVGGVNAISVNEGGTVNFNVNTTNVASGTSLSYTLSGVSAADVTGGSLGGTVTVGADGKAVIPVSLVADQLTEGAETLTVTVQGQSASVTVNDTSTTPAPTYSLAASAASVNEGGSVTYTVTTTNIASGTQLAYALSGTGITTADISDALLTGITNVAANGTATFTVNLTADQLTEGAETLTATVMGQSASVTVNDTSTAPIIPGRTKYFVLPSSTGANFTDFDLAYGSVTLTGEQVTFVGSSAVDALFVRPGVTMDFTLSGSGADKIYLGGNFASYTASIAGSVMTLQRGSGATLESVSFIKSTSAASSDNVIFADGTLNSLDLYNNLKTATALPALATTETSLAPLAPATSGSVLNASIKAFALSSTGDTFAPAKPGVAMTVVGSLGVDTVYVARGGVEDCTLLGSGQDLIYFTGNWGDYTKVISGSVLTFSRTVDGYNESVRVVGSSTNISLNDHLVFADGAVYSGDAKTALTAGLTTAITAVTGYDATMTTPGIGTALLASPLNGVTNLEVSSNIVLNYSASVSAVAGKYIHIVNDGGTGFHGESTVNTLNLLVTDTTQVSIVGGRVTLNPTADLDLANNYHITIDTGAFTTTATGAALAAYDGTSTLHFSTVTPGTSALANAVSSQTMNADGTLGSGHLWLDIEGIGSPSASAGTALDLSANNYTLVAKDYDAAGGSAGLGYDGIKTADFYVAANNFGSNDLLYIDNQSGVSNDMTKTNIINLGTPPTTLQFAGTGLGGFVNIALAGSTATFDTIAQMKTLLGASTSPVISA